MNNNVDDKSLIDIIEYQSKINPKSVAIEDITRNTLTYDQLRSQIRYTVRCLNSNGLRRNDRIAVILPNGPEMALTFLGVASCATCAPLNPSLKVDELNFYLKDMNAKALITYPDASPGLQEIIDDLGIKKILLRPGGNGAGSFSLISDGKEKGSGETFASSEDVALILHTSGTTARPKMVPLTHSNLIQSAQNISKNLELTPSDRCLNVMPLFHIHGLVGCLLSSISVGSVVTCTQGFDIAIFLKLLRECSPTWFSAVPTMHQAILMQTKNNIGDIKHNLRFIRSCSAALPPQIMSDLEDVFHVPVVEAYGMTEASHQIAINPLPPRKRKPRSVGLASGLEVSTVDDNGNFFAKGELGEIVIKGPSVTRGYENNPEANANAFIGEWFRTGDQGYIDEEDYIFLTDRIKEIINRGGEKVSPREVDEVILTHPAVKQAVTFPLPDDKLGEEVVAAVVLRENANISEWELQRYLAKKVAGFKVPRRLIFVEDIPKGPTGKIQRRLMAQKLNVNKDTFPKNESEGEYKEPTSEFERKLVKIWSKVLKIDKIGVSDNYFALGGDSLRAEEIVAEISQIFGIENLPIVIFIHAPTIEKMSVLLSGEVSTLNSLLVKMQPYGDKSPLFLIHACEGEVLFLTDLVSHLGKERPIYAFRAPFLNGEKIPDSVIEDYAIRYLKILTNLSDGPINLAGVGPGGYIALEMAHRLKNKSGNMILMEVINPKSPYVNIPIRKKTMRIFHIYQGLLITYSLNGQLIDRLKKSIMTFVKLHLHGDSVGIQMDKIYRKNHNPRVFDSSVLLLLAEDRSGFPRDPNVRVNELKQFLIGKVETHIIKGEHLGIFKEPNVGKVADLINAYLNR